jgi:hypothetical protein
MPKADPDPDFHTIISRATVERLARGSDNVAVWALEMLSSAEGEEAVFLRGARAYLRNIDRTKRRRAITALATTFEVKRDELKRYLRFKGLVNVTD